VALRPFVRALPILIAISALGNGNAGLFATSRYCMVGARYGYLPEIFAYIQRQRLTPLPSIVLQLLTFHEVNSLHRTSKFHVFIVYLNSFFFSSFMTGHSLHCLLYSKQC
jgi:amino acid transporter